MKKLEIRGLCVSYNGMPVLEDLQLDAEEGEFVAIVGKSGCGKTTLLNAIAGFVKYSGSITKPDTLGMVSQDYAVFPWLTAGENISFGMTKNDEAVLQHYLKMIDLLDKRDRYPFELSGGQKQRLALARALVSNPDLVLMDEPYGALDIFTREKMQRWLMHIWEHERKTILFVTHSIDEALLLADRVLLLNDGAIQKEFRVGLKRPRAEGTEFSQAFLKSKMAIRRALS